MNFNIATTWDGCPVEHSPTKIELTGHDDGCHVNVEAPFFNDPGRPSGRPGEPFPQLWDYEVVEMFFLNDKDEYLEVELCPHGQHLVLLLKGRRNIVQDQLELPFTASTRDNYWQGETTIPHSYFPPNVSKFNAYAIHGSGSARVYKALFPVETNKFSSPDFHRLEYFQQTDFAGVLKFNQDNYMSDVWTKYL